MSLNVDLDKIKMRICVILNEGGTYEMSEEHILVCLSSSPTNGKIIRVAARMAQVYQAGFTALYVETPDYKLLSDENKKRLRENISLAKHLGAFVETVYGDDIPFQIATYARVAGVTRIVIGRSNTRRRFLWYKQTLVEKLIHMVPNLDIHIIPDQDVSDYHMKKSRSEEIVQIEDILKSVGFLLMATVIGGCFRYWDMQDSNIVMIYIIAVLLTAVFTSRKRYSLAMSAVSVLVFNYFHTEPYFTMKAYSEDYPVTFLTMFCAAFVTSTLAGKMKQQMKQASESAYRTKILLETNQMLQQKSDKDEMIYVMANQLVKLLKRDILFYPTKNEEMMDAMVFPLKEGKFDPAYLAPEEHIVAEWVFHNNRSGGATTEHFSKAKCLYFAIRTGEKVLGVVGIPIMGEPLEPFENNIVLSILGESALALEKEEALREREESALLAKNEQLRANLLRSISHDLRTPLTAISGNADVLLANAENMDGESRKKLYADIYDDSLWLINLVENLLSVTKIEDGSMKLHRSAELIDEIVHEALQHVNLRQKGHKIVVEESEDFLLVKVDARMIMQVVVNIVDNAIKYTPPGTEIRIRSWQHDDNIIVDIADNGNGIPDSAKERVFESFYVVDHGVVDSRRSLGLGLSLCKTIITAHGGTIVVLDNRPQGAIFRFTLPKEEVMLRE